MNTVRAKFQVSEIASLAWSPTAKRIKFQTQYDTSIPEDQRFCKATPSGDMTMIVDNPAALEVLQLGGSFYVDFTPIPKE